MITKEEAYAKAREYEVRRDCEKQLSKKIVNHSKYTGVYFLGRIEELIELFDLDRRKIFIQSEINNVDQAMRFLTKGGYINGSTIRNKTKE